jgi:hypothetical protein
MITELVGNVFSSTSFGNELGFWNAEGGNGSTVNDAATDYLSKAGFSGTLYDMFNTWITSPTFMYNSVSYNFGTSCPDAIRAFVQIIAPGASGG